MIFSVSNDGIEWSLDFGPDSVTDCERSRPRKDIKFARNSSAAWSLLFLKNHLARVPATPNQQGTHEMVDEILSSVGAQEGLETSGYQESADLDDVEFYIEKDQLDVDAVFRPGIDTPFSPTAFDDLEMRGSAENTILLDEDKENSPPPTTTLVSERPTRNPALLRSRPFKTRRKLS